jgi:hypothetical protein
VHPRKSPLDVGAARATNRLQTRHSQFRQTLFPNLTQCTCGYPLCVPDMTDRFERNPTYIGLDSEKKIEAPVVVDK